MTKSKAKSSAARAGRHRNPRAVRSVRPADHATRGPAPKVADSLVCDHCGVVQHAGRWHWGAPALGDVRSGLCPACRCIRDHHPVGTLRIPMPLVDSTNEVMQLVHTAATTEQAQHPLERLIDAVERNGELVVTTTGVHLVRRLVTRLQKHVGVRPVVHYDEDGTVAVTWSAPTTATGRGRRGGRRSGRAR